MEIGQIVGAIRINKPYKDVNKSYECAAWWEEREVKPGIYELSVGYQNPHDIDPEFRLFAKADAVVTDDYFPALWGGVSVSNKPYKPKHVGESRQVSVGCNPFEAIDHTGHSPIYDNDVFVNPQWWREFLKDAERRLEKAYKDLPIFWEQYKSGESEVGIVGHFGRLLKKYSKQIAIIEWEIQQHKNQYNIDRYNENTVWARDFLNLPEWSRI